MIWDKLSKQTIKELKDNQDINIFSLKNIIRYKKDKYDQWQSADETWKLKSGDCEDFSLFMMAYGKYFNKNKWCLIIAEREIWNDIDRSIEIIGHAVLLTKGKRILDFTAGKGYDSEKEFENKTGYKVKYRVSYNMVIFWFLFKRVYSFFWKLFDKIRSQ